MKKEFLQSLGLDPKVIAAIMAEFGKGAEGQKAQQLAGQKAQQPTGQEAQQMAGQEAEQSADQQAEQPVDGEMQTKVAELETTNQSLVEEYEKKLKEQAFGFALGSAIEKSGARNKKALMALLDMDVIGLEGGALIGFDEQVMRLRDSDAYLFEGAVADTGGGAFPSTDAGSVNPDNLNDDEFYQQKKVKGEK